MRSGIWRSGDAGLRRGRVRAAKAGQLSVGAWSLVIDRMRGIKRAGMGWGRLKTRGSKGVTNYPSRRPITQSSSRPTWT